MLNLSEKLNNFQKIITLSDFKEIIFQFKEICKSFLKKIKIFNSFFYLKKKKFNSLLDSSNFSETFFKKYLGNYYNQPSKIKNIFYSKPLFSFSSSRAEKKEIIISLEKLFPNFKLKTIEHANLIINNQFKVYEKIVNFKDGINWNYSFFKDTNWPVRHSSKIEIYPKKNIGDIRYNWEFNIHSFLITLGLAYYFTEYEKYSKKLIMLILDWTKKNPPIFNSSWKNSLITSYRLISWIFSLKLIFNSKVLNDDIFYQIFKTMFQKAFYISVNSLKYSYNHIIGEMFGLFLFSCIFKKVKYIKKLYLKSSKLFLKQIKRQTLFDGVNIERSVNYHRVILESFSLFLIIKPNLLKNSEKALINKMFTFLAYIIKPDDSVPLVGDFDEAHMIPACFYNKNENHNYFKELLSLGCILFNRSDLKYICSEISPATILLLGIKGYEKFKKLDSHKPKNNFYFFKNGGYFVAKNSFKNDSNFIFFDMAEFSISNGAHDHLDISNIIYSYLGKAILIDSGTYRYNDTLKLRNKFRSFKAHNVLVIKGKNNVRSASFFGWNKIPRVKFNCLDFKKKYIFEVQHDGFDDFLIKRKIIASKDLEKIDILDFIFPQKNTYHKVRVNIFFHFHKNTKLELINNEVIINDVLKMNFNENNHFTFEIKKDTYYHSPLYGVRFLSPLIKIDFIHEFYSKTPLIIKTKLIPLN